MITIEDANAAFTAGNNRGDGYAYYHRDDSVSASVRAAIRDGWEIVLDTGCTSDVIVLRNALGELLAIGGDAMGRNAWAVDISEVAE